MADGTILIYENSTFSSRNIAHSVKHQERARDWCPKRWRLREIFKKRWNPDETRKEERRGNDVRPKGRKGESERGREEVEQRGGGRRDGDDDGWIHRNPFAFWAAAMNSRDNHGRSPPSVYGSLFQLLQLNLGRKRAESNIFSRGRNYNGMEMFRRNF